MFEEEDGFVLSRDWESNSDLPIARQSVPISGIIFSRN